MLMIVLVLVTSVFVASGYAGMGGVIVVIVCPVVREVNDGFENIVGCGGIVLDTYGPEAFRFSCGCGCGCGCGWG